MKNKYKPTIGMEIHVHLKTRSKMFCGCENVSWKIGVEEIQANSAICPVCTGQPGSLPVLNLEAIKMIVKAGLALNCQIAEKSKFDRKNYFYPDLPKGYQISQYDEPICEDGYLEINKSINQQINKSTNQKDGVRIRIKRIHAEEDTGSSMHPAGEDYSLVDLNRAGVPLMELVTEPDIHSARDAKIFCQELREIFRALGISSADMEKGQMRCEVNVSVAPVALPELEPNRPNDDRISNSAETPHQKISKSGNGINNQQITSGASQERNGASNKLGTKVEVKNLNSFKAVERAIEYEVIRQGKVLDEGGEVVHETRGWDERKQETVGQRTKEEAADYRYFPEPDLPPLRFGRNPKSNPESSGPNSKSQTPNNVNGLLINIDEIEASLPELPGAKRARFMSEYGFKAEDARILVGDGDLANYTENVVSELKNWLVNIEQQGEIDEVWEKNKARLGRLAAGWLINKLGGLLAAKEIDIKNIKITAENFAELITLIYENKVNSSNALSLLEKMLETGGDPSNILEDEGMGLIDNVAELEPLVDQVVKDNPDQVKAYQEGKEALLKFFVGQVMKLSKGKANPKMAEELLLVELAK